MQTRCNRCVLPGDFPGISFDGTGVCSLCRNWDNRWKNFDYQRAHEQLLETAAWAKRKKRKYDCLVPFSGGKDSTYVLYLCKAKYGLNPLAVTLNNGFLSDFALHNIFSAVRILGVDHVMHSVRWDSLRTMYRTMVEKCGEFCSICSIGIRLVTVTYQQLHDIPLIASGTSSRTDEQSPFEVITSHPVYVRRVLEKSLSKEAIDSFIRPDRNEWSAWRLVKAKLFGRDYRTLNLPDLLPWKQEEIEQTLSRELDWSNSAPGADHSDCRFAQVKYYLKNCQKPGFIFKVERLSQLIRDGQITREAALEQLQQFPPSDLRPPETEDFKSVLGISEQVLANTGKVSHMDYVQKTDLVCTPSISYRLLSLPWQLVKAVSGTRGKQRHIAVKNNNRKIQRTASTN